MAKTTVLHELLAVEQGLGQTANLIQKTTTKTLDTKKSLFEGMTKEHIVFDESKQHLKQATDIKEVQDTVDSQLDFLGDALGQYWDVILQKQVGNQKAKADIIIDDKVLVKDVPSMVLLDMEKKIESLIGTYNAIPTLDASRAWELDPNYSKPGVYRVKYPEERQQANTTKTWQEISAATPQHPAQLKEIEKIEVVGKYIVTDFSSAKTSYEKSEALNRITTLHRAIKAARQRANNVEVDTSLKFGKILIDYINGK